MPKTAKQKSVFGAARIISGSIFLSRILGFVRDILCAGFFGWVWDAFIFAFTIPNLFRRLFGEGALSAAFIPTFSHYLENKPRPDTLRFISAVITSLVTILSLMAGLIILGTFILPAVLPTVLPATYPAEFTLFFAKLLRILIPYLPIICLVALLGALLNTLKHFTMPALASVVLNISWIAGFFIGMRYGQNQMETIIIIAWSIIIGGILEILIQIPALLKHKISYRPRWEMNHPGVKEIKRLMFPAVLGLAPFQINLVLDYLIAVTFITQAGAISALYFGNRLMQFPLALVGISLATALFPFLARYLAQGDLASTKKELEKTLRLCLFIALPAAAGLIVLAQPIIQLAFGILPQSFGIHAFSTKAVNRSSLVLICYASGLWAYAGFQILTRVFYAFKDMKTPARLAIYMILVNLALNLILVRHFREAGIALSTAIVGIINFGILLFLINKKLGDHRISILFSFVKSMLTAILMGIGCHVILTYLPSIDLNSTGWSLLKPALLRVLVPVFAGLLFYFLISCLIQPAEIKKLIKINK